MAWIARNKRRDGTVSYWIRDVRDGQQIVIDGGNSDREAQMRLEQYRIRRDLEKEGYDDRYASVVDELFGKRPKGDQ